MEATKIKCIWCGEPMERGHLFSGGRSMFLPENAKIPKRWTKKYMLKNNCIPLKPMLGDVNLEGRNGFDDYYEIAYACRNCRKIVIPYEFVEDSL